MTKKILLVEDSALICMQLKSLLSSTEYKLVGTASSGEEAIVLCREKQPDLVLMDIGLIGEMDGIETSQIIKKEFDCGIIFLTAHSNKDLLEKAKNTSPVGYLIKPYTDLQLLVTLEIGLKLLENIKRFNMTNKKLDKLARVDYLTNLPNRRNLSEKIELSMYKFQREQSTFGVILLDIDHFKTINDTYGHEAGDYVLKHLTRFLSNFGRKQDVVGRWGGDEFLWILDSISSEAGLIDFIKILKKQISLEDFVYKDVTINLSCSFGYSLFKKGYNIKTLVKKADDILYKAKRKKYGEKVR